MKLCKDCVYFRGTSRGPKCRRASKVTFSLVYGEHKVVLQSDAEQERRPMAKHEHLLRDRCGTDAKFFVRADPSMQRLQQK